MTWSTLLLGDPSACLRYLVLRDLHHRTAEDAEFYELAVLRDDDPLLTNLLRGQSTDGAWEKVEVRDHAPGGAVQATSQALTRLGYLGFGPEHPAVERGAEFIFRQQRADGSWPQALEDPEIEEAPYYDRMPLQTSLPLRGLAACGYAEDPRAEKAYEWLLGQRLPDGAWPTGVVSGNYGYVAGYRRLPHSRWGCRANTTAALICLAHHPERRHQAPARKALDHILARETRERQHLGFEIARIIGVEPSRGWTTYFARFDLGLLVNLCWRIGATTEDERVQDLVRFLQSHQGAYELWDYLPQPQATRWVTFDLLRSLANIDDEGDWLSPSPRTPFQDYKPMEKRF
jgi:hypothetical protein